MSGPIIKETGFRSANLVEIGFCGLSELMQCSIFVLFDVLCCKVINSIVQYILLFSTGMYIMYFH